MPQMPVTIYTASGCLFSEQAKAWLSEAGICYTEIDTTADAAKVEEMKRWAGGTWVFPTIVIGQEVGLGFDPEWIQAQLGLELQGAFTGGSLVPERIARPRNGIVARLAQAKLNPQENDIRKAILRAFAQDGTAPSVREVAQAIGLSLEDVLAGFRKLAEYDLIVWKEGEACLLSAYPFSGVSTVHRVLTDAGKALYAMCAMDALGIPFMLGLGASVRSACFFCQQPVRVDIAGGLLQRAHPAAIIVWFSERDGCCVAKSRCPLMNFFCNEGHLQAWLAKSPNEPGTSLSLMDALEVGKAAFGELLK
ncbi:MAG: organomercurial lyase [Candidatus Entotheonellia bacterium]